MARVRQCTRRRWALALLSLVGVSCLQAQRPESPFYQLLAWPPDGWALAVSAVMESWDTGYRVYVVTADGAEHTRNGRALYPMTIMPPASTMRFSEASVSATWM
ncbi:MAG: hypothetical protein PVF27_06105 [Gemmatimonadales bacterium]|jgi:hypothetical protein